MSSDVVDDRLMAALHSFDGTEHAEPAGFTRPRTAAGAAAAVEDRSFSIRGAGLNYSLASAADGHHVVSTRELDCLLDYDAASGLVTAQPGLTVGALAEFCVSRGRWFPVLPGYPTITIGGCAAMDTHGKAQHGVGHFHDHVESFVLWHPDHGELTCSRAVRPELFELTLGGLGLTGLIVQLTLRTMPLAGELVRRERIAVDNLAEAADVMLQLSSSCPVVYAWNDMTSPGPSFGRGIVYAEYPEPGPPRLGQPGWGRLRGGARGRVPLPPHTRLSARAMARVRALTEARRPMEKIPVLDAAFPISGLEIYFHLFGGRGFHESQFLIPLDGLRAHVARLQREIAGSGAAVTLGSLKLFSGRSRLLRFTGDGLCVTIDAPATPSTLALFGAIDRMAADWGTAVNLAKDSRLDERSARAIFPEYEEFALRLAAHDPDRRVGSVLRERIGV